MAAGKGKGEGTSGRGRRAQRSVRNQPPSASARVPRSDRGAQTSRPGDRGDSPGGKGIARGAASGQEYIEGRNSVLEALRGGLPVSVVYVARGTVEAAVLTEIRAAAQKAGVRVNEVERRRLDELSDRGSHHGVIAQVRSFQYATLGDLIARAAGPTRSLIVALDHITDPVNLGAVARSAEAAGATGIIIPAKRSVGIGPVAFSSSAGALAHLPVARETNLVRALEQCKEAGYWVTGASERARDTVWEAALDDKTVLVMGSEGTGLGRLTAERCDQLVRIPMAGKVGSLNVAQAATVCMYEWLRRGPAV